MDSPSTSTSISIQFLLHQILESQKICHHNLHHTLSTCLSTVRSLNASLDTTNPASPISSNFNSPNHTYSNPYFSQPPPQTSPWLLHSSIVQPPPHNFHHHYQDFAHHPQLLTPSLDAFHTTTEPQPPPSHNPYGPNILPSPPFPVAHSSIIQQPPPQNEKKDPDSTPTLSTPTNTKRHQHQQYQDSFRHQELLPLNKDPVLTVVTTAGKEASNTANSGNEPPPPPMDGSLKLVTATDAKKDHATARRLNSQSLSPAIPKWDHTPSASNHLTPVPIKLIGSFGIDTSSSPLHSSDRSSPPSSPSPGFTGKPVKHHVGSFILAKSAFSSLIPAEFSCAVSTPPSPPTHMTSTIPVYRDIATAASSV